MVECPECGSTKVVFTAKSTRWGSLVTHLLWECRSCGQGWEDYENLMCPDCQERYAKTETGVVCRSCGDEIVSDVQLQSVGMEGLLEKVAELGAAIVVLPDGKIYKLEAECLKI